VKAPQFTTQKVVAFGNCTTTVETSLIPKPSAQIFLTVCQHSAALSSFVHLTFIAPCNQMLGPVQFFGSSLEVCTKPEILCLLRDKTGI
jgi:hypothetical protein